MTEALPRQLAFEVGVIVERCRSNSPWVNFVWEPVAVLPGRPDAAPWTLLADDGARAQFFGGVIEVTLHGSESGHYRENLLSATPSIWVALRPTGLEPPYELFAATADPAEGESFTQAGQSLVGAVPLPAVLRDIMAAFVEAHPVRPAFYKRRRDEGPLVVAGVDRPSRKVRSR